MSPVWAVPVVVATVGGAAVVAFLRGTTASARELAAEVVRFGEIHAALSRLRNEIQRSGETVAQIRQH